jgi:hypothetical protein
MGCNPAAVIESVRQRYSIRSMAFVVVYEFAEETKKGVEPHCCCNRQLELLLYLLHARRLQSAPWNARDF